MSRFISAGILIALFPGCATLMTGSSTVKIDTTPPGATVSVNGFLAGSSPLSTDLYPGDKIKLELDNHKTRVLIMGREKTKIKPIFFLNPLMVVIGTLFLSVPLARESSQPGPSFASGLVIGVGLIGTSVDLSSGKALKVRKDSNIGHP